MQTISEKTYLQITEDLDAMFLNPTVIDFIKSNDNFKVYLAKDINITYAFEKDHSQSNNANRLLSIFNNLGQSNFSQDDLWNNYMINDEDINTNHKILKQQLYKHLSLTINDIKTNLSKQNKPVIEQEAKKIDNELIQEQTYNTTIDSVNNNQLVHQNIVNQQSTANSNLKKSNGFLDFFKKPGSTTNLTNVTSNDQLRRLSLEDKFIHAKKTQYWYKKATETLMWIYFMPVNKKKRVLLAKTNFVKNFNQTYSTHFQVANLERRFEELYIKKVDGFSFKNAVRIWIILIGLPIIVMIILLATLLPKYS